MQRTIQRGTLLCALLTKYYLGDQMNKNEMGVACDTHGRVERCVEGFGGEM